MHAQKHHRGAHRPSHLKAVKPTDPPHPGREPEQKPGPTSSKASPPHEDRLAKLATFTTNLRVVSLNLLLLIGACLVGAVLWKLVSVRETVIENIYVPEAFAKIGYSSDAFQSFVAGHLIALEERAADVIPASAKEEIKLDSDMPDFSVPGTSISAKTILQYVREALPLPVSTISGSVTGTPDHYVLHLILVERGQVYRFATPEGAIADLEHNLSNLALDVLKKHSPYIYASYESAEAQTRCYAGNGACNFSEAERIFSSIIDGGDEQPNYNWALLGLSKIDEAYHDYKDEINAVSRLSAEYPSSWSFYNWGVALSELGCHKLAIGAFERSIALHSSREAAFNAIGRAWLALARQAPDRHSTEAKTDLQNARDDFRIAAYLKPDYQEAHVNLAESLKLLDDDNGARREYVSAIEMDPTHAGLAYARYAELVGDQKERSKLLGFARWADNLHKECRATNSTSLLEALGCSVAMQAETARIANTDRHAGIETVAATVAPASDCRGLAVDDRLPPEDGAPDFAEIAP
ncbi:tetratricopeptide repeat protein [Paraburkholderia sp.]|uniref:tetratricopeptide repeat protein n=1 Tax=Paraburkholderia sp. TaxID=1926495 RepID=UPI002D6D9117|nr:tetratricopeptide repeat protein [Paraburkholderia sp.]HZZ02121.1 tetratricopeptide repeat protein [Paraburkholderia sp.]